MKYIQRPIRTIRFTKDGYDKLKADYDALIAQRPEAVEDLRKAREMGDLSENGFYKAARAKLSSIDSRLRRLTGILKDATIIEPTKTGAIGIGTTVTLSDGNKEFTYEMVGDLEANPSQGKISLLSPIGRAIAGRKEGERVTITIPTGEIHYRIVKIA